MNVEIRVAPMETTAGMTKVIVLAVMDCALAGITSLASQVVATLILTFLRQGRSSLSAIPGNINFTLIGGEAA